MRTSHDIVKGIAVFQPEDGNWLKLDALFRELWETGEEEKFTVDLLHVLERFPEEDGAGVFESIVHGLEHFKTYEVELLESLNRQPSEVGLRMLRRIKNSGAKTVGGIDIRKVVTDLLSNERLTPALRQDLMEIIG
ncbi:MAG: hypothetical protein HYZ44_11710 [Bacteroidetes bacterium]|nr:hypothetical protein [Bacteroidota bacterium]